MKKIDKIIKNLTNYLKDENNIKELQKFMEEELKKPCFQQLQCINYDCKYLLPKDFEMGTITFCSKYKYNEDNCKNRIKLELYKPGE